MFSALSCSTDPQSTPNLVLDLQAAGILVKAALETGNKLVQAAVLHQPDVVICAVAMPGPALWKVGPAVSLLFNLLLVFWLLFLPR